MNCPNCQRAMNLNTNLYTCPYCGWVAVLQTNQTTQVVPILSVAVIDDTSLG